MVDEFGPTHFCRKLINLVERTIDHIAAKARIPEITQDKLVSLALGELVRFAVDSSDPVAIPFQTPDKMSANKPSSPTYQCCLHGTLVGLRVR